MFRFAVGDIVLTREGIAMCEMDGGFNPTAFMVAERITRDAGEGSVRYQYMLHCVGNEDILVPELSVAAISEYQPKGLDDVEA